MKVEHVQKRIDVLAGHDKKVDLDKHKIRIKGENAREEMVSARQFITDPKYGEFGSGLDRLKLLKNGQSVFDQTVTSPGPKEIGEVKTSFTITPKKAMGVEYQRSVESLSRSLTARNLKRTRTMGSEDAARHQNEVRPEDLPKQ